MTFTDLALGPRPKRGAAVLCRAFATALVLTAGLTLFTPVAGGQEGQPDHIDPVAIPGDGATPAPLCGTKPVTIADMGWPSASILAAIHALVLEGELGCQIRVIGGDNLATLSSMATTGEPAIAPELWIGRVAEVWNSALKTQSVRRAGNSFDGGPMQGWFVPEFAIRANRDISQADALAQNAQSFRSQGRPPRFVTCPLDWACNIINANLIRAYGIEGTFEVVTPANRFELDQVIAEAMSRREPLLFYYWQPNAALWQFGFDAVDLGPFDPEALPCLAQPGCRAPKKSAFAPEPVIVVAAEWLAVEVPAVFDYLGRASMPLEEMNRLLAWQNAGNADSAEVAAEFYENSGEIWEPWVADLLP
ncbi:MAG: hypothetical protein GXP01_02625 [Alphaproteobacteria bacterium]|nr:hypothetical protein [Alphaproteobacteria bacterium]